MTDQAIARRQTNVLVLEALTFGLAYGASLCWASACLVGCFRPNGLSAPYWNQIPQLRTDTSGIIAFFAVALFLPCSEFLRLRRRWVGGDAFDGPAFGGLISAAGLATCETIGFLTTGLVIYLSVNTVTHPETLSMQATHLASWPTEGTLRVSALLLCVCSAALFRFLRAECNVSQGAEEDS